MLLNLFLFSSCDCSTLKNNNNNKKDLPLSLPAPLTVCVFFPLKLICIVFFFLNGFTRLSAQLQIYKLKRTSIRTAAYTHTYKPTKRQTFNHWKNIFNADIFFVWNHSWSVWPCKFSNGQQKCLFLFFQSKKNMTFTIFTRKRNRLFVLVIRSK